MIGKLVIFLTVLVMALARPQYYSGYNYGGYVTGYPSYSGYSGYSNPVAYNSYGYSGLPYSFGYGAY